MLPCTNMKNYLRIQLLDGLMSKLAPKFIPLRMLHTKGSLYLH